MEQEEDERKFPVKAKSLSTNANLFYDFNESTRKITSNIHNNNSNTNNSQNRMYSQQSISSSSIHDYAETFLGADDGQSLRLSLNNSSAFLPVNNNININSNNNTFTKTSSSSSSSLITSPQQRYNNNNITKEENISSVNQSQQRVPNISNMIENLNYLPELDSYSIHPTQFKRNDNLYSAPNFTNAEYATNERYLNHMLYENNSTQNKEYDRPNSNSYSYTDSFATRAERAQIDAHTPGIIGKILGASPRKESPQLYRGTYTDSNAATSSSSKFISPNNRLSPSSGNATAYFSPQQQQQQHTSPPFTGQIPYVPQRPSIQPVNSLATAPAYSKSSADLIQGQSRSPPRDPQFNSSQVHSQPAYLPSKFSDNQSGSYNIHIQSGVSTIPSVPYDRMSGGQGWPQRRVIGGSESRNLFLEDPLSVSDPTNGFSSSKLSPQQSLRNSFSKQLGGNDGSSFITTNSQSQGMYSDRIASGRSSMGSFDDSSLDAINTVDFEGHSDGRSLAYGNYHGSGANLAALSSNASNIRSRDGPIDLTFESNSPEKYNRNRVHLSDQFGHLPTRHPVPNQQSSSHASIGSQVRASYSQSHVQMSRDGSLMYNPYSVFMPDVAPLSRVNLGSGSGRHSEQSDSGIAFLNQDRYASQRPYNPSNQGRFDSGTESFLSPKPDFSSDEALHGRFQQLQKTRSPYESVNSSTEGLTPQSHGRLSKSATSPVAQWTDTVGASHSSPMQRHISIPYQTDDPRGRRSGSSDVLRTDSGNIPTQTNNNAGQQKTNKSKGQRLNNHPTDSLESPEMRTSQQASAGAGNNRYEIPESPTSKQAMKDFYHTFRNKEKESVQEAFQYATASLTWLPMNTHWRIKLELADISKRLNDVQAARKYYEEACNLQPLASQCWQERSKFEEDCGNIRESLQILTLGLQQNFHEALLMRAIKQYEKLRDISAARNMLSVLKHKPIDKIWKAMFEGALLEARAGQVQAARELFKFLMENIPWHGPIYHEAACLEERYQFEGNAIKIVRRGLEALSRYGPLWFTALRIAERIDRREEIKFWHLGRAPKLDRLRTEATKAIYGLPPTSNGISKELFWKVYFELSQSEERSADIAAVGLMCAPNSTVSSLAQSRDLLFYDARVSLLRSLMCAQPNLRWKIWLAAARLELSANRIDRSRSLLFHALKEAPTKSRSQIFLECARVEEFAGNVDGARRILHRACIDLKHDWKLFLEVVLLESRNSDMETSYKTAQSALLQHPGTGRLWVMLIQLSHRYEIYSVPKKRKTTPPTSSVGFQVSRKEQILLKALLEVPKSGEVWCEGARCCLNPLIKYSFDFAVAQRDLCFAIQFTPQNGDTFIEYLRLEVLCQVLLPRVLAVLGIPFVPFVSQFLNNDPDSDLLALLDDTRALEHLSANIASSYHLVHPSDQREFRREQIERIRNNQLYFEDLHVAFDSIRMKSIQQRCLNADPNYGISWFYCRESPVELPSTVLENALQVLMHDLLDSQALYNNAIYTFVIRCLVSRYPVVDSDVATANYLLRSHPTSRKKQALVSQSLDSLPIRTEAVLGSRSRTGSADSLVGAQLSIENPMQPDHVLMNLVYIAESTQTGNLSAREKDLFTDVAFVLLGPDHQLFQTQSESVETGLSLLRPELEKLLLALNSTVLDCVELTNGSKYYIKDYLTALVTLSRLLTSASLDPDDKRRVLFGADQISP